MDDKKKKRLDNLLYLGFDPEELSDLPAYLETPQILTAVTNSMNFKDSFLRLWTPVIRSEASNAILMDSFWWFYLHFFKVIHKKSHYLLELKLNQDVFCFIERSSFGKR